jgi:hypothetical protein
MMATGDAVLYSLRIDEIIVRGFLKIAISFAIGLGLTSISVLILGWALPGALATKLGFLTFALGGFSIHFILRRRAASYVFELDLKSYSGAQVMFLSLAIMGLVFSLLSCFSPITYYDSLVYHLALPTYYLQTGRIMNPTFNLYSFFPQGMEMIYLLILSRLPNPEYVINLFGWVITLLSALVVCEWAEELGGERAAILSFTLWWTMPAVLLLSNGAYVDVPLAFIVLLTVRCYSTWRARGGEHHLWLSGVFSGMAFSRKQKEVSQKK